jgi:hypothetical protein
LSHYLLHASQNLGSTLLPIGSCFDDSHLAAGAVVDKKIRSRKSGLNGNVCSKGEAPYDQEETEYKSDGTHRDEWVINCCWLE